ncbi:SDR family NAD(P)-dependent oxidoreductase [Desulfovibrio inopinatus]|uniref:SDR family NAD(P)-dependent oxidoreductase n=1 Tax=Desulfovibrio inopinatus TaxID=102109 RepID=UPI0004867891|nr:SDR family NAD(P)-dependent oxidoreductase [Desulfovibrio inopinatus]
MEQRPLRAVIIGASSGIGEALARRLSHAGWQLGLAARRVDKLKQIVHELGQGHVVRQLDVTHPHEAMTTMDDIIRDLGGMDLLVLCAGTGHLNTEAVWEPDHDTIAVNVTGFAALAQHGSRYFMHQHSGHLVGITSVASLRSSGAGAAYSASKAFESFYLDGLRALVKDRKLPITVTEIIPGFVDTAMMQAEKPFWVAQPEKAAEQIYHAIHRKAKRAYITKRWAIIGALLKLLPR